MEKEFKYSFKGFFVNVYNILTTDHYCFTVWVKNANSHTITFFDGDRYGSLKNLRNPIFEDMNEFPPHTEKRSKAVSEHYKRMERISKYLFERAKRKNPNLPDAELS